MNELQVILVEVINMVIKDSIRKRRNRYAKASKEFIKRITRTTYDNTVGFISSFGKTVTNPFDNSTTWLTIYSKEPFIRGAVDALVNAVVGEFDLESAKLKESKADEIKRVDIYNSLTDPASGIRTKLATMCYKLVIDSLFVLETNAKDKAFYVLNKEDCTVVWNDRNTVIEGVDWSQASAHLQSGSTIEPERLHIGEFVIGSIFDPDTNLWQNSPMETLIDMANLLYHARQYNLDIFKHGGVPSMLYSLPPETTPENKEIFKKEVKKLKAGENLIGIGEVKAQAIAGFTKDMEYNVLVDHAVQSIMTLLGVSPLMMNLAVKSGSGGGGEGTRQEMNAFATRVYQLQRIINDAVTLAIHNIHDPPVKDGADPKPLEEGRVKKTDIIKLLRFKLRKWVDIRQQAAMHKIYIDTGVLNPNEARKDIGKEPRVGGDEYSNSNDRGASGNTGEANPSGQDRDPNQEDDSNEGENENDGNRVDDKALFQLFKEFLEFKRMKDAVS